MRKGALLVALVVGVFAAAAAAATIVKVGPRSNGKRVALHAGDALVVSLPGNATTGYRWRVRSVDRAVLKPGAVTYVAKKSGGKVGVGGTYVLRFRALRTGITKLRLIYVQAAGTAPAKTYALRVVVLKTIPRV
jgi:inhibitor of cysteine peptidase